jgi:hypothetical protein
MSISTCKPLFILFISFFFNQISAPSQDNIIKLDFIGLKGTQPQYIHLLIQSEAGAVFDSARVMADLQNLRNQLLFSDVSVSIVDTTGGKWLQFYFDESMSRLPIGNFGGISDNFWFQVGAVDYNFKGRGITFGGYYRYYDRHSLEGFFSGPYLFGRNLGASITASRLSTIEPTDIDEQYVAYDVDRYTMNVLMRLNFSYRFYWQLGGGYLRESYDKNLQEVNLINYYYHYLHGFFDELNFETVHTRGEKDVFWKFINILKYYHRIGELGNLAVRWRLGISQNKLSPFVPFVLDSYITVRGSGNRVTRGTAEFTVNLEYRHTFYQRRWGAIQGVGFIDWSAWRQPGGDISSMFEEESNVTFAGVGVRLYFRKIYNLILRLDYGFSIIGSSAHGVVFGTGQYF